MRRALIALGLCVVYALVGVGCGSKKEPYAGMSPEELKAKQAEVTARQAKDDAARNAGTRPPTERSGAN